MKKLLFISISLLCLACSSHTDVNWTPLFNGNDLSGWDTWLAKPHSSYDVPNIPRDSSGNYLEAIGLNNDPLKVFTVSEQDGQAVIRISGQGWGAITTKNEYQNYHLSLEYKWGEKKWVPREKSKRDSGILYHCVGEHGAGSGAWMQSQECQVQEGDTGDYWSVAGAIVDIPAKKATLDNQEYWQYDKDATIQTIGKYFDGDWNVLRCLKYPDNENPNTEWNHVEVYALGDTSVHVVNGETVMVLYNSRRIVEGQEVPLVKGKIQIQTEGAEIYYKDLKIRSINTLPKEVLQ